METLLQNLAADTVLLTDSNGTDTGERRNNVAANQSADLTVCNRARIPWILQGITIHASALRGFLARWAANAVRMYRDLFWKSIPCIWQGNANHAFVFRGFLARWAAIARLMYRELFWKNIPWILEGTAIHASIFHARWAANAAGRMCRELVRKSSVGSHSKFCAFLRQLGAIATAELGRVKIESESVLLGELQRTIAATLDAERSLCCDAELCTKQ